MNIRADFFRAGKSHNGVLQSNDPDLKISSSVAESC
jgi:hypothetical protein